MLLRSWFFNSSLRKPALDLRGMIHYDIRFVSL